MAQFVSKNHKLLAERCRILFPLARITAWPDAEMNLGYLAGVSGVNLRADIFIEFDTYHAVAIEWQSEIHTPEGCKSDWFDYDDIAGRDDLKKQLCAKSGVALLEMWTLDVSDDLLQEMVTKASDKSYLSEVAVEALATVRSGHKAFGTHSQVFKKSTAGWKPSTEKFKAGSFGSDEKMKFKPTAFGKRKEEREW